MSGGTPSGLLDSRGCLTAAGIAALGAAPPGQGPSDLAAHVVGCARCQERLLAQSAGAPGGKRPPARRPSLVRTLALGAGFLLLIALLFLTLARMSSG